MRSLLIGRFHLSTSENFSLTGYTGLTCSYRAGKVESCFEMAPSSNGLGGRPLTPIMWIRIPTGSPVPPWYNQILGPGESLAPISPFICVVSSVGRATPFWEISLVV